MCCMYTVYSGMQEWVIQIPSIPILVSVLFPSLHLKYFRIKFLLLVYIDKNVVVKYNNSLVLESVHKYTKVYSGTSQDTSEIRTANQDSSELCVQINHSEIRTPLQSKQFLRSQ